MPLISTLGRRGRQVALLWLREASDHAELHRKILCAHIIQRSISVLECKEQQFRGNIKIGNRSWYARIQNTNKKLVV